MTAFSPLQDQETTERSRQGAKAVVTLPRRLGHVLCLDDFEALAQRHLPAPVFAYVSGGVERNQSLRANARAFDQYEFVTRVLVDTSKRSTRTTLFGDSWSAPFGIAPMGVCALSAYRGDLVLTQAAAHENVPMVMSGSSLIKMEEVVQANPKAWFQAYLPGADAEIVALIDRVNAAGFETLVVTLDVAIAANRENNIRAGFSTPLRPSARLAWQGITHPRWLLGTFLRTLWHHGMPHFENNYARRGAPILSSSVLRDFSDRGHLTWDTLRMVRRQWPGRLVVKGILDVRDARMCVQCGVDGEDSGRGTIEVLPEIAQAVNGRIPIFIDSGFRRGTDILKALAMGANGVAIGRPYLWGLGAFGQAGVERVLELLRIELYAAMQQVGAPNIAALKPGIIHRG